jgi:hypothetical protein
VDASVNGGMLTVRYNGTTIGMFPLSQAGNTVQQMSIPMDALLATHSDGRHDLTFVLDSGLNCDSNQHTQVVILPSTTFTFPNEIITPDLSLLSFPRPLYQQSIFPDTALLVVPDQPTAAELQGALTVSAGLTNLTNGGLEIQLATVSEVTPEQLAANHVILVGKPASLPQLSSLSLPLTLSSGSFDLPHPEDGVVMMASSPWNPARAALVVSGNSDAGIVKAGQAVSTGLLRPNSANNLAIVESVERQPALSQSTDQSLADLGYSQDTLSGLGVSSAVYEFYVPAGQTLTNEAYFDINYAHSGLLDYSRSGLSILLNGQPVSSIPLNETSAKQTFNTQRITIPASAVVTGLNHLEVSANLIPLNDCSALDGNLSNGQWPTLWATIWPESRLHLPMQPSSVSPASVMGLNDYPAPFVFDPALGTTAFVLQKNDPDSWRMASRIAGYLGNRANGALTTLKTYYADDVPADARVQYNLLAIGQPSQLPLMEEIKDKLPIPFASDSGLPEEKGVQVIYRIPEDSPLGYIELLTSPWNEQNVLMAVLGNTSQGVQWAANALVDSTLRGQLAGNFSVITDRQVISTDTRVSNIANIPGALPESPDPSVAPSSLFDAGATDQTRPMWPLYATLVAAGLAVLVVIYVIFRSSRK